MVQRNSAQDRLGRSLGPEMMKRPRPCRLPQPTTPPEKQIVGKVLDGSPNYMKGTRSSECRRHSQVVQAGLDKKRQTGKKQNSCAGDKKQSSCSNRSLESESMVSLLEGQGIESCGSGDENLCMMIENFVILEQSENPREDQESEEGGFSDNSINLLLSKQDDITVGNAVDEKLNSMKAYEWKEPGGEKVEELIKLVSKTKETLLTLVQKPCNREECIEDWKEYNPRESHYIPINVELSSETLELKHRDMDERQNAEEWMIDYALQHTVNKLAVGRKKNVALLVEAFEIISPTKPSPAFTHGIRLQVCN